jgi:hypothetical protein
MGDAVPPSSQIIDTWLKLVKVSFIKSLPVTLQFTVLQGVGRDPMLIALVFIEGEIKYEDLIANNFCV